MDMQLGASAVTLAALFVVLYNQGDRGMSLLVFISALFTMAASLGWLPATF